MRVIAGRRVLLEEQLATTNERLDRLAKVRTGYANEVSETKNRAVLLERAEQNLAEARAARASANAASLISRIDRPDAGIHPIGPGRTVIALSGIVGGLLAGFGVVFLAVPAAHPTTSQPTPASNGHAEVAEPAPWASKTPANGNRRLSLTQALHKAASGTTMGAR